jgi:branched-chain amino acid transport system substrate-binding protein
MPIINIYIDASAKSRKTTFTNQDLQSTSTLPLKEGESKEDLKSTSGLPSKEGENVDFLKITLVAKDNSNGAVLPGTYQYICHIPVPSQELINLDNTWRTEYHSWLKNVPALTINSVTEVELQKNFPDPTACQKTGNRLVNEFNRWIDYRNEIKAVLPLIIHPNLYNKDPNDFCFILHINTGDPIQDLLLQRLPFHTWKYLRTHYPNAEITLSTTTHALVPPDNLSPEILVIFGDDDRIDFTPYENSIGQSIREQKIATVNYWSCKPKSKHTGLKSKVGAISDLFETLKSSSPKVIIFVGHSESTHSPDTSGSEQPIRIKLNDNESIFPHQDYEFQEILRGLVARGLIFFASISCDGSRIASEFNNIGIPYIMVSREILPIHVAEIFLNEFLNQATKFGVPIHIALSRTRQYLKANVERNRSRGCPNASNFLVIYQVPQQHSYILRPNLVEEEASVIEEEILKPAEQQAKSKWQEVIEKIEEFTGLSKKILSLILLSLVTIIAVLLIKYFWPSPPVDIACDSTAKISPYLSCGEKSILDYQDIDSQGKQGMDELKLESPDYSMAVKNLGNSWKNSKRNPEVLIALSNAKIKLAQQQAIKKGTTLNFKTIAVVVPVQDKKLQQRYLPVSLLNAVAEAQRAWNEKNEKNEKPNNWLLEVMIANDQNKSEFAPGIVKNIVGRPMIIGVTGSYSSFVTKAVLPLYQQYQLTLVSGTSTATNLGQENLFFLRVVSANDIQATQIITFLKRNTITDVELLHGTKTYAMTFKEALERKAGNIRIHPVPLTDEKLNASDLFKNLKANKSKIIILLPDALIDSIDRENVHLILQENTHPEFQLPIIGNELVNEPWVYDQILKQKELGQNLIFTFPWNCNIDKEHCSEIYNLSPEWWRDDNQQISHRTVLTYDATNVLIDAIDLGITARMSDRDIRSQLPGIIRKTTHNGMTGTITFKENSNNRTEDLQGLAQPQFDKERKLIGFKVPNLKYQNNKSE